MPQFKYRFATDVPTAYTERESKIVGGDGRVVHQMTVRAPAGWSQTAVDVCAQKYCRKAGVPATRVQVPEDGVPNWLWRSVPSAPDTPTGAETDFASVFHRLAGAWTYHGWKAGYFDDEIAAKTFYAEVVAMLEGQLAAPNSPQWFNTGLFWAYGIEGTDQGQWRISDDQTTSVPSPRAYVNPGVGACFIQGIEDNLVEPNGILDFATKEARIFKFGSGSGANYSPLRGKDEPLSGGGKSSGLPSFLVPIDKFAGAIKSGGTCLAPDTPVFTEAGPVPVRLLAEEGRAFVCLSYDPPAGRYKAKRAMAWRTGVKRVVRVTTDKGAFDVSYDHPMKTADGGYVEADKLTEGTRLFACHVADANGYLRVSLRTGVRGGGSRYWHRLIAEDVLNATADQVVDHHDGNKRNNTLVNLRLMSQSQHASRHGAELVSAGNHVFQQNKYPKTGATNPMAAGSAFWADEVRSTSYKNKQGKILRESGRAATMAVQSSRQRMLNLAWKLINMGCQIPTLEAFISARAAHIGRVDSGKRLKKSIEKNFGSYELFLSELNASNHRVVSVVTLGEMEVYDVQVDCPTTDARTESSGHNFVIWSGLDPVGSGVCVHNTRRAARMTVLDLDHPDVEWFVDWKVGEEYKVACLVAGSRVLREALGGIYQAAKVADPAALSRAREAALALGVPAGAVDQTERRGVLGLDPPNIPKLDTDYEGAAYETVNGQNANNSVSVPAAFLAAVRADGDWHLYHRTELKKAAKAGRPPAPCKTVKARKLWRRIAEAAWACADPGVQFVDTMNDWNTVLGDGRIDATNPCSEYLFLKQTTCNLACLNLLRLVDLDGLAAPDGGRTEGNFAHAVRIWTYVLDITVGMSGYPAREIADGARKYRTLGLGYANLGALLMRLGVPYDSDAGRGWGVALTALVHFGAAETSAELACRLGQFPRYSANQEHVRRVFSNHYEYLHDGRYERLSVPPVDGSKFLAAVPGWLPAAARLTARRATVGLATHGHRNAQLTLVMPAGTVGLVMDCDTTGVEPDFSLVKFKKLAGGGYFKIVNQSILPALRRMGYDEQMAAAIETYVLTHGSVEGCPDLAPAHLPVFDTAVTAPGAKRSIAVDGHLLMMAAVQPLLSGGISKCVAGDTIIPTDGGLRRIGTMCEGQPEDSFTPIDVKVPTSSGMTRATHFYYGGRKPVWSISLADGRSVRGTAVHRLRVATATGLDWKVLPELSPGDYVAVRRGTGCWGQEHVPTVTVSAGHGNQKAFRQPTPNQAEDVALFLGMLTSDGHVTKSNYTVGITKNEPAVLDTFLRLLQDLFGITGRRVTDARTGVTRVQAGSKSLTEWLGGIGFSKSRVPDFVLAGSKKMAMAYLSGLYLDGYFATGSGAGPSISQKHGSLLDDVRALWDNAGIATYLNYNRVNGVDYPVLHVSGRCRKDAADMLTWLEPHKAAAAAAVRNGRDERIFPMHRTELEQGVRDRRLTTKYGNVLDRRSAVLRRSTVLAAAADVGLVISDEELALDYIPVVAVAAGDEEEVFDLAVPGPEEFVGNGIVNHNTVNLPSDATVDDVERTYARAGELMVKCVALYRDGSKLSQPLEALRAKAADVGSGPLPLRGVRRRLGAIRKGHTAKLKIPGHKMYLTTGEFDGGELGEIFLTWHKEGATLKTWANLFAQAVSLGLQYGVPLGEFVDAFTFVESKPNGPVADHPRIKSATSIVDLIFRHLAIHYDGREDLAHVTAGPTHPLPAAEPPKPAQPAGEQRKEGNPCSNCGRFELVRNGTCSVCQACGTTTGCV